jgi:hypothetical protein
MTGTFKQGLGGLNGYVDYPGGSYGYHNDLNDILGRAFTTGGVFGDANAVKNEILGSATAARLTDIARAQIDFELNSPIQPEFTPHYDQDMRLSLGLSAVESGYGIAADGLTPHRYAGELQFGDFGLDYSTSYSGEFEVNLDAFGNHLIGASTETGLQLGGSFDRFAIAGGARFQVDENEPFGLYGEAGFSLEATVTTEDADVQAHLGYDGTIGNLNSEFNLFDRSNWAYPDGFGPEFNLDMDYTGNMVLGDWGASNHYQHVTLSRVPGANPSISLSDMAALGDAIRASLSDPSVVSGPSGSALAAPSLAPMLKPMQPPSLTAMLKPVQPPSLTAMLKPVQLQPLPNLVVNLDPLLMQAA